MKGLGMVGKIMCESLCVDEDGREWRVGILKEGKGKEKWKENMKRKKGSENEMKINGDGYGKNKLVE